MEERNALDALHGWLVLLPLLALALPGPYSLFLHAPDTVSLGVGAAALAVLPAALFSLARARGGGAVGLAPLMVLLAVAAVSLPRATDVFGAWRALVGLTAAAGYALVGASLGPSGRIVVQRGLTAVGVLLLASLPVSDAWSGSLGNSGDLSEAALPCAVLGAGVFLNALGPLAFGGFALLFVFAAAAGVLPAYAGILGLVAASAGAIGASVMGRAGGEVGRRSAARRARILLIALLVAVLPIGYRAVTSGSAEQTTAPVTSMPAPVGEGDAGDSSLDAADAVAAPTTTGGFDFRRLTWARIPDVIEDAPALGVGPGQFQAAFPPYRDPAEIELSSFGRKETTPQEVEHAHNDPLTALVEYGFVGGGAFLVFLLIVLWRGLRQIAGAEPSRRDFGLAAVALLANATVNAPLLYGPLAPALAFLIFGVVMAPSPRDEEQASRAGSLSDRVGRWSGADGPVARYLAPGIAVAALLLLAPKAWTLVQYGRELAGLKDARVVLEDGREGLDAASLDRILRRAETLAPTSPVVLEKQHQLQMRSSAPAEEQRAVLDRWLAVRPNSLTARLASGTLAANQGDIEAAFAEFEAAYAVDPGHPALLRNRVRAACDLRDPLVVEIALEDLTRAGYATPELIRTWALDNLTEGRLEVAQPLVDRMLARTSQEVDTLDPNSCFGASKRAEREGDEELEVAFMVAFQMTMALEHLKDGSPESAAASARQAYQRSLARVEDRRLDNGAIRLRLAAARAAAGDLERATERLTEAPIRAADKGAISDLERGALATAGLLSESVSPRD